MLLSSESAAEGESRMKSAFNVLTTSIAALFSVTAFSVSDLPTALAQSSRYSCSTNAAGKAVVLDSSKPGKTFTVAKVRAALTRQKSTLNLQRSAIKGNKRLSKAKKAEKLAAIKLKLDEVGLSQALVKSCSSASPTPVPATPTATPSAGGSNQVRTQLIVNTIRCFNPPFSDCDFRGSLFVQAESNLCAQSRTITVSKNNVTLNSVTTAASTLEGNWDASIETNPGPGTYVVDLAERQAGSVTCLAAQRIYTVDESGAGTLVSENF